MNKEEERNEIEVEAAKKKAEEDKELEDAAKKIQAAIRGRKARQSYREKHGDTPKTLENLQDTADDAADTDDTLCKAQHNMITMLMETTNSRSRKVT